MHKVASTALDIDVAQFGKVGVIMGGWSAERDVSLMGGEQVLTALSNSGVDAHAIDADRHVVSQLASHNIDHAFLILHGRGGEDGVVQAALELAGIPYTGTGVLGSALCMDKWRAKTLASASGISTPKAQVVASVDDATAAARELGFPVVVKPTNEGSSVGVSIAHDIESVEHAFEQACQYGAVLVEQFMSGSEVTAAVLNGEALPLVSMKASGEFYDYHAKYLADDTEYVCPARLDEATTALIQDRALSAFEALGCRGWGRVDFMLDSSGHPQFIECNTAPGMTSHSLVPIAAKEAGLSFEQLCLSILATCLPTQEGVQ